MATVVYTPYLLAFIYKYCIYRSKMPKLSDVRPGRTGI
nr:putative P6 protein [Apple luteovirus 1]